MKDRTVKAIAGIFAILGAYGIFMSSPYAGDGAIFASVVGVLAGLAGYVAGRRGG